MRLTVCKIKDINRTRFQAAYLFFSKSLSCSIARNPANASFLTHQSETEIDASCEGFEIPINADEHN